MQWHLLYHGRYSWLVITNHLVKEAVSWLVPIGRVKKTKQQECLERERMVKQLDSSTVTMGAWLYTITCTLMNNHRIHYW